MYTKVSCNVTITAEIFHLPRTLELKFNVLVTHDKDQRSVSQY